MQLFNFWFNVNSVEMSRSERTKRLIPILNIIAKPISSGGSHLPNIGELLSAIISHKNGCKSSYTDAAKAVVEDVMVLWRKNAVPVVSKQRIQHMATKLVTDYSKIKDVDKSRQTQNFFREKAAKLKVNVMLLNSTRFSNCVFYIFRLFTFTGRVHETVRYSCVQMSRLQ